jgi:hypothetical protein
METTQTTSVVNNAGEKLIPVSELLSKSFGLSKVIFWKVLGMIVLPMLAYIPMGIIVGLFYLTSSFSAKLGSVWTMVIYIILGILALVAVCFAMYVYLMAQVGTYLLIKEQNNNPKIWPTFKSARPQIMSWFETNLLASAFIFLWFLLLIVPGIIMAVYYNFVVWVFMFEGLKNKAAMRRSKELVKGQWWAVFGRFFLVFFPIWLVFVIPSIFIEPKSTADQIYSLITNIISLVITPFSLAYSYHIYKSLVELKNNIIPKKY